MNIQSNYYAQVIQHFGSLEAIAKALEVGKPAVSNWKTRGIPAHQAVRIEQLTEGKLKAIDLLL